MPNDKEFELDDLESFSFDDLSLDDVPPGTDAPPAEDPLGVWVKSAPEDLDSLDDDVSLPLLEETPLSVPDDLPEEDFLSSEELANLDDSFEFVTVSDEPQDGETTLDDDMTFLDTPEAVEAERSAKDAETSPGFNEVSLDDFVSFDEVSLDDSTLASPVSEIQDDNRGTAVADDDEAFDEEFLDIDIDIEDDINDEELEIIEGGRPRKTEVAETKVDGSEEVDLSEFVDFEEVTPAPESLAADEEDLPEVDVGDDGFFEESILDDSLPALEDEGAVVLDVDLEPDDQTDLDSLIALEEDLTSGIRESETPVPSVSAEPAPPPAPAKTEPDLAAQILGKIEQELSSIKQEISELKHEMTQFRSAPPTPVIPPTIDPKVVEPALPEAKGEDAELNAEQEKASHGFFDEEDDETIALTGDELDNILSTAEISEGEEVGLSLDEDLLSLDDEGNLIEPESAVETEEGHVTDEEFLAGTGLDLDEPSDTDDSSDEEIPLGVPESIELEESLSEDLDDAETEDLLAEGLFGDTLEPAEAALEDDLGLEADSAPLTPELIDDSPSSEGWDLDSLPPLDTPADSLSPDLGADADGWSAPVSEPELEAFEELEQSAEPQDQAPVTEESLPPPPPVSSAQTVDGHAPLPSGLKDELRAVLTYMDKLLASLPDDKIQEFAESEHFEVYKRLFEELGLIE